ncbi:hypothetical protein ACFX19_028770 [Malus domestica]
MTGWGICRERSKEAEKVVLRASRPASRLTAVFEVVGSCEARDGGGLWVWIVKLRFCQSHSKAAAMAEQGGDGACTSEVVAVYCKGGCLATLCCTFAVRCTTGPTCINFFIFFIEI